MERVEHAARTFQELGHEVEIWDGFLPNVAEAWSALLNCDLYAQVQADLEGGRQELGRSLVALLEETRSFALADLLHAQGGRTELNRALGGLFSRYALLLTPTAPHEAFAAEGPPPEEIAGVPVGVFDLLGFAYPFNFSGHPAASVPAGRTRSGLPVGLQIVGPRHRDDLVLQAARAYEVARPWSLAGGEAAARP
jgi:Asp-tRNA(Asn)/Glu-tRNA(Gln) amidotransferase A subunit family amidase